MKSNLSIVKYLLTFCALTILINPYFANKAIAGENSSSTSTTTFKVTFNPPQEDQPKTSQGAASRCTGECNLPFVPLIPTSATGLTVAAHPTILVYFPQTSGQQVLFSWRDENNQDHYQTVISLNPQIGVTSFALPKDAPPLEVGKNYLWGLAIISDGKLKPDTPTIEGQIRRVALDSTIRDRLKTANPLETAMIYGEAGIWYETVATLAKLKTAAPDDHNLAANWEYLLTSVGLENISEIPTNPLIH